MEKKKNGLLFNFGLIFAVFTVITLAISGVTTYLSQMEAYQSECEQNIRNIGEYLEQLILADGSDFLWYQQYYMEHFRASSRPESRCGYPAGGAGSRGAACLFHL